MLEYQLQFFAKDGPGGEKTEQPTSKKLEDARKEGQVAKSKEVANAAGILALFLIVRFYAGTLGEGFVNYFRGMYNAIPDAIQMFDSAVPFATISVILRQMILQMLLMMGPVLLIAVVIAFVCDVVQVKWKLTGKPLQPKFSKLNPVKGFGRIFSKNSIVELIKSIAKIGVIGYIAFSEVQKYASELYLLYDIGLYQAIGLVGDILFSVGIKVAAAYMVIALLDFAYQKWKFRQDMMMTKQEVKDEYKNSEGDPKIKSQQRQRMQQASQRRMMQDLPNADVVITNPTHLAVAIRYDKEAHEAPVVVAKGADYLAQKIKDVARANAVEIVENKPLARMLYHNVEIGAEIPPELYQMVAEVLAYVYSLQGRVN